MFPHFLKQHVAVPSRGTPAIFMQVLLYIALDGVAPRAKMNQQRSRFSSQRADLQQTIWGTPKRSQASGHLENGRRFRKAQETDGDTLDSVIETFVGAPNFLSPNFSTNDGSKDRNAITPGCRSQKISCLVCVFFLSTSPHFFFRKSIWLMKHA